MADDDRDIAEILKNPYRYGTFYLWLTLSLRVVEPFYNMQYVFGFTARQNHPFLLLHCCIVFKETDHPRLRVSDVVSGHKAPGRAYNFYFNKLIFAGMIRIGRTGMRRHMESKEELKTAAALRTRRMRRKFRMTPCRATVCAVTAG